MIRFVLKNEWTLAWDLYVSPSIAESSSTLAGSSEDEPSGSWWPLGPRTAICGSLVNARTLLEIRPCAFSNDHEVGAQDRQSFTIPVAHHIGISHMCLSCCASTE